MKNSRNLFVIYQPTKQAQNSQNSQILLNPILNPVNFFANFFVIFTLFFAFLSPAKAQNLPQNLAQNTQNSSKNSQNFVNLNDTVSVSIPPQAFFVRKIAANSLNINVLVPKGVDEHNLDFKPRQMQMLEKSSIYFTTGLEFERIFEQKFKASFKNLQIVDIGENLRFLKGHDHDLHDHDLHHENENDHSENDHDHENDHSENAKNSQNADDLHEKIYAAADRYAQNTGKTQDGEKSQNATRDPHIWLDPVLIKSQAQAIANTLTQRYPAQKAFFEHNLLKFQRELDELHAQLCGLFSGVKQRKFIIYHPSLSYFASRYDFEQIAVEIDGKEPKARDLQRLIDRAKSENIKVIFAQKSTNAIKSLAKSLNADIYELNHLAENPLDELRKIAKILGQQ